MPIRTVRITSEQREELIELCRQYSDLQKKAVEIRWALNNQVAALGGLVDSGEVAGLLKDFTQIEVVSVEEWKEALLNVTSERWVCTGFAPAEPTSSSPAEPHREAGRDGSTIEKQRTVNRVLTTCLTQGDNLKS